MSTTDQNKPVAVPVKKTVVKTVAKRVVKSLPRPVLKDAPQTATTIGATQAALTPTIQGKSVKRLKAKKPKLVRDSFTIPKLEYLMLEALKLRGGKLGSPVKKSALIRAGIQALAAMPDASFLTALKALPAIKAGRPSTD